LVTIINNNLTKLLKKGTFRAKLSHEFGTFCANV
jgi:hypothetical protein